MKIISALIFMFTVLTANADCGHGCGNAKELFIMAEQEFEKAQLPEVSQLARVGYWKPSGGVAFSMGERYLTLPATLGWGLTFISTGMNEFLSENPALKVVNHFFSSEKFNVHTDGSSICWSNDFRGGYETECRIQPNGRLLCRDSILEIVDQPRSISYHEFRR